MNPVDNSTNGTRTDSTWYTCWYPEYDKGRSSCWESENCKPMTIFLQVLSIFGFVSNVAVFIFICVAKRLHKPMYTGIRMLTVPDALFLLCRFIVHTFQEAPSTFTMVIVYTFLASFYSSVLHVILLSVQQYLMIAYPLKCLNWIRNKRILIASAIIWICAFFINIPYFFFVFIQRNYETFVNTAYTVLLFAGPISVLGILHILKIAALKKSLVNNSDKTTKRVSQIITIVVGIYVLTTTPSNIRDLIEIFVCPMVDTWYIVFGHIGRTLLLVNHSINPFVYFISTPQFRRTVSNYFGVIGKNHEGSRFRGLSETNQSKSTSQTVSVSFISHHSSSDSSISTHL